MNDFNIYSQLDGELEDFFTNKITIGGSKHNQKAGYKFSQFDTLNTIQFVGGSRFEKGEKDGKIYLNNSVFRADVAAKQVDIDVSNIRFQPVELHDKNITILKRREFKRWSKDIGFGIELNNLVEMYPFWGHLVVRKVKGGFESVPLTKIRCQQDAKDLNSASYVIIEHEIEAWEAQTMPDWDLSGLEYKWNDTLTVYERFGRVPAKFYAQMKGESTDGIDDTESVDTVSFIVLDKKNKKKDGNILFIEKVKRDFKEVKWKDIKGRWLGQGEIENNFDNQKARNAVFNLRLRSAMWSAKNLFQSTDETVSKNLATEVADGTVITVTDQGITPINTQTKALADFSALDDVIESNADQKSFTYEVATGEQLNSGTPFRLGAILSNSVNNHFGLKREKLSLFIKEVLYDFILPSFKKDTKGKHVLTMASGEDGYNELFGIYQNLKEVQYVREFVLENKRVPNPLEMDLFRQRLDDNFEITVEENAYDVKDSIDIVITGESVDIQGKMETLSNLYQLMLQNGDPRADAILEKILVIQDEQLPKAGTSQQGLTQSPQQSPLAQMTNLALPQNVGEI